MNLVVQVGRPGLVLELLGSRGPNSDPEQNQGAGRDRRSNGARQQILLVEDDRSIREVLRGILEEHGYAVTTAENGRQALEDLRRGGTPDLIILDLRMPVMDGWQFRAAQKVDPVLAGIPVLAISADGSAKAEAVDAAAYLRKPLSTDSLLSAISRILVESERKRLIGRLEDAERFAALGRLAASIGHEINNPLAYVSMNLDMVSLQINRCLMDDLGWSEDLSSLPVMLAECRTGVDRIRDIVKDLQGLSRKSTAVRQRFSLNALVDESLAMAHNHVRHRARVRKEYGAVSAVLGDRSAMGQVLLNLILNAAQSLPEGRADANEIVLRTAEEAGHVTVEVSDTGAGIPADVLPHIFDPFFTTRSIREGTGLGLAVSFRIVADHGGRIDVDTEVGRGSSFRVVLPTAGSLPQAAPVPKARPDRDPARGRVLVIDDVPAIGETIVAALPEHDVTIVARASDAFAQLADDDAFDVILCDLMMPELGGRDVLERLEADWPHLANALIFMAGGAFTPESRRFLQNLPLRILRKPFSIDQLRTTIVMQLQDRIRESN